MPVCIYAKQLITWNHTKPGYSFLRMQAEGGDDNLLKAAATSDQVQNPAQVIAAILAHPARHWHFFAGICSQLQHAGDQIDVCSVRMLARLHGVMEASVPFNDAMLQALTVSKRFACFAINLMRDEYTDIRERLDATRGSNAIGEFLFRMQAEDSAKQLTSNFLMGYVLNLFVTIDPGVTEHAHGILTHMCNLSSAFSTAHARFRMECEQLWQTHKDCPRHGTRAHRSIHAALSSLIHDFELEQQLMEGIFY